MLNNIQHKTIEVTIMNEPIAPVEEFVIYAAAETKRLTLTISESGRIISFQDTDVKEVINFMAHIGFEDEVGLIKEIIEYWPNVDSSQLELDI